MASDWTLSNKDLRAICDTRFGLSSYALQFMDNNEVRFGLENPSHTIENYAEVEGDKVGREVGRQIEKYLDSEIDENQLRDNVEDLLIK